LQQILKRLIFPSKSHAYQGDIVCGYVDAFGPGAQLVKDGASFSCPADGALQVTQRCSREGDVAGHFDSDLQFFRCTVNLTLLLEDQPKQIGRPKRIGMQLTGFPALLDCLIILTGELIVSRHVNIENEIEWIEFQTAFAFAQRFFGAAHCGKKMGIPVVAHRIVWI
jgi:hypothetical protein